MDGILVALIVIGGLLVLLALYLIASYNGLVVIRNQVKNAWSQIDIQLKRRFDLIPNLVNTVKGYLKHESEIFTKIAQARTAGLGATTPGQAAAADSALTASLRQLFAVVENYPELKASQNMRELQEELTSTENKISFARQLYNDVVLQHNNKLQVFPTNIIAGMFQFKPAEFFQVETAAERQNVKVELF